MKTMNMKSLSIISGFKALALLLSLVLISCSGSKTGETEENNEKSTEEVVETEKIDDGWISLFDGKTFEGWKTYNADEIEEAWSIEEGVIVASKKGVGENVGFGHSIITKEQYGNFELEMDYKLTKGGNSGIMYHVIEDTIYNQDYETGPEFQFLDDEFSTTESLPNRLAGASYDMYAPKEGKKLNPHDEWNTVKLVYNNGHVEHWLNGEKVVEYEEGSEDWQSRYNKSKWVDMPDWGKSKTGHIGLQNHGDAVWFRNIRIKKL